jgi:hypothetical protein
MLPVLLARFRQPALVVGMVLAFTGRWQPFDWLGLILIPAALLMFFVPYGQIRRAPIEVRSPVRGRWVAVNSPADKVPSHGVHSCGQTYAIDLVYWPDESTPWQGVQKRPLARRANSFPGFGQPIFAPASGTVVKARDFWRDHWSRNSWPGILYLLVEGNLRELLGPGGLLGNHVVLDLGNGVYAAFAHLRRGSIRVTKGERVTAGQQIAECGNSGNSSEPHLHFQLMDHAHASIAAGLPFTFEGSGVPHNQEPLRSGADVG